MNMEKKSDERMKERKKVGKHEKEIAKVKIKNEKQKKSIKRNFSVYNVNDLSNVPFFSLSLHQQKKQHKKKKIERK